MVNALEIKNLVKVITQKKREVFRLDIPHLQVHEGDLFALLGPNGSGKTTLIYALLGLMKPDQGTIAILGKNPWDKNALREVNFLLTDQSEPWPMRVRDILDFYADVYEVKDKKERIEELAELLNLQKLLEQPLYKCSSGEQTRVMIAKALINKPHLLLLDEPTHNLDTSTAEKLRTFLLKLNQEGTTIFFTSHMVAEIERLAKRVAFIKNGTIQEILTKSAIKKKYGSVRQFMNQRSHET
ncbi:ABC transporter ATP-binding protein [Candidatus Woesearchaeota archaeon]|nr:ABC transporter ATP-binding protein [Candidatus Woesearchaeota archaeon]